jgi:site-specific DNA-methyltransferase (cytosine-N4-specific)
MPITIPSPQSRFDPVSGEMRPPTAAPWTFSGAGTLDTTHGIHPYVASMNPHLARLLIKNLVPNGTRLLDPFVGGGTVLVEALRVQTAGSGLDVNPLGVLISKVKTTHVERRKLTRELARLVAAYPSAREAEINFPDDAKVEFWFKPYMLKPLRKLVGLIRDIRETDVRDAFRVVLSATVRDVSLTYRGEVRLRRLVGKDMDRFSPDVLSKFQDRAALAIGRIAALPCQTSIDAVEGNARAMPFRPGEFSTVICSPPYGDDRNGVGYFQFSKNMLYWLGYDKEEIHAAKQRFLGEERTGKVPPRSPTLSAAIALIREHPIPSNPRAEAECVAFYSDYQDAVREMARVCSGKIAIVIGDRRLSETFIDNARITTDFMETVGFHLVEYHHRVIDKKRIPVMQPGHGQRDRSGGGLINREHTLIYARIESGRSIQIPN